MIFRITGWKNETQAQWEWCNRRNPQKCKPPTKSAKQTSGWQKQACSVLGQKGVDLKQLLYIRELRRMRIEYIVFSPNSGKSGHLQCGAPKIVFSWDISGWILCFMVDITLGFMGFPNQFTTRGAHIVWITIVSWSCLPPCHFDFTRPRTSELSHERRA